MRQILTQTMKRLGRGLGRVHSDEAGQSMVFAVLTILMATFFAGAVYRVGFLTSNRMKVQSVADGAAYSMALSEAQSLSALAWQNEGEAQIFYHLSKYAVDVIVAAVNLEYAVPGPKSPGRQPDPNVVANAAALQQAYDAAYQRAAENIPYGKRLLAEINLMQQNIRDSFREETMKSGVYGGRRGFYRSSGDEKGGAAFAMTQGHTGRRGVEVASIFPDYEDLDGNDYVEIEQDYRRFGLDTAIRGAYSGTGQSLPQWYRWFDMGVRGSSDVTINLNSGGESIDFTYWDLDRSVRDPRTRAWATLIPRTFARMGRLFFPDAHTEPSWSPRVLEEPPNNQDPYDTSNEPIELGRGYEQGDTVLYVDNTEMLKDENGQYIAPFFARIRGRDENHRWIREEVTVEQVTANTLVLASGLQHNFWIWHEQSRPCQPSPYDPNYFPLNCARVTINGVLRYFRRNYPRVDYGRYVQDGNGNRRFVRIPLMNRRNWYYYRRSYHQTRGPCWDTREILQSETPTGIVNGPTGVILDASGQVRDCPTCGGIDYDGDQLPDVRIFAWHTFYHHGSTDLDESDYMDVRLFNEHPDDRIDSSLQNLYIGDSIDQENSNGYGISGVDPPLVLSEEFFRWGINLATHMTNRFRALILPASWEPGWGFLGMASARPAMYDRFRGEWIIDFGQYADPILERQNWLDSRANLYLADWEARLVQMKNTVQDSDASTRGFSSGLSLILNQLIYGQRAYDERSQTYEQVVRNNNPQPNTLMRDALQEMVNPRNPNNHQLDINNPAISNVIHH